MEQDGHLKQKDGYSSEENTIREKREVISDNTVIVIRNFVKAESDCF